MDIFVTRGGTRFVWDSERAALNATKHGVTFDRALDVFFDPLYEVKDASVVVERRFAAIGRDRLFKVLYVVHLILENEAIRVISARFADASERRAYENAE